MARVLSNKNKHCMRCHKEFDEVEERFKIGLGIKKETVCEHCFDNYNRNGVEEDDGL